MLEFNNVTKFYNGGPAALDDVSLFIAPGEFVSVVGHSGAGKSTLIKMILAEEQPSEGVVNFEEHNVAHMSKGAIRNLRRRIGTVFQDFRLLPTKTVYENIAFAMEATGQSDEEIEADVPHVLDLVDLSDKMNNFPHELSGGEQQRVALARAIVNQPDIIVADEPTGNLDPVNTYEIVQILRKINELGATVILTTHNKGVIDSLGKRVITMDEGRIVRDDKAGKYSL